MAHRWGEAAGVPNCLPHRFRRSRRLLAHGDIKSTMLYTGVAPSDRAKAVLRLPWRPDPKVPDGG